VGRLAKRGGNSIPRFLTRNTFNLLQIRRCEPLPPITLDPVKSIRFVNFGCKANLYDTQVPREALLRRGLSEQKEDCELRVVNTGTFTAKAGLEPRQLIRRVLREQPETRTAVTGCLTENELETLVDFSGLSGHHQRVRSDSRLIDGPPPSCLRLHTSTLRQETTESTAKMPAHKVGLQGTPFRGNLLQGSPIKEAAAG
jgi:hypothetical protein